MCPHRPANSVRERCESYREKGESGSRLIINITLL
nr:MAG TPA: hypothetical protein [Caudoviricetes sp.]